MFHHVRQVASLYCDLIRQVSWSVFTNFLLSHTKSKPLLIRSISENMYTSVRYTAEQPCTFTINWLLSIFKTAVGSNHLHAHCKCMGNYLQPHNFFVPSPNGVVLKCICANFKGLSNGANFILIDVL